MDTAMTRTFVALVTCIALGGCLGTTEDERRREEIGEGLDPGPEHNPGEPCLLCHGEFALAGTVYLEQDDRFGLEGARVFIEDGQDRLIEGVTNRAGNFIVSVEGEASIDDEDGWTYLDFTPEFPMRVRVTYGDLEQEMETLIQREGSCNECHYRTPSADSVGHVFLVEP